MLLVFVVRMHWTRSEFLYYSSCFVPQRKADTENETVKKLQLMTCDLIKAPPCHHLEWRHLLLNHLFVPLSLFMALKERHLNTWRHLHVYMTSLLACNSIVNLGLTEYEPRDGNKLENTDGLRVCRSKIASGLYLFMVPKDITLNKPREFKVTVLRLFAQGSTKIEWDVHAKDSFDKFREWSLGSEVAMILLLYLLMYFFLFTSARTNSEFRSF